MGLPVFFKLQKNKRFNFVPRYYDERKEELKKKLKIPTRVETLHVTTLLMFLISKGNLEDIIAEAQANQSNILISDLLLLLLYYF